jgi:hypothetical protein
MTTPRTPNPIGSWAVGQLKEGDPDDGARFSSLADD